MIGRIVRPADFERVLSTPQRCRSTHFAVHHVGSGPAAARPAVTAAGFSPAFPDLSPELSTGLVGAAPSAVDESGHWLGLVVPKRFAKRAVTRNLIKRQIRAAAARHELQLPPGMWVVRLRAPVDRRIFTSPASDALRDSARHELALLFQRAVQVPSGASATPRRGPPA